MNIIRKTLKLSREEYYNKHLLIINHILPIQMTPKEAKVLAHFMALEGDLSKDPFSTTGRKIVRQGLGISAGGLGNYLEQLKQKGFIKVREDKVLSIIPILNPGKTGQGYQFKLEVDERD